jgi:hypothetical protein
MRKWLGIGVCVSMMSAAFVGGGVYWLVTKTARREPAADVRVVQNATNNDVDAEPSEVIEPLVVQQETPAPEVSDAVPGELARVVIEPGMDQPPRPDVLPDALARMPYADEQPGVGRWFFLDWQAVKAMLSQLNLFTEVEKTALPEESENRETNPPLLPPQADPVPDYHQQYPHCPYQGPCPMPYRSMPRD